MLVVMVLERRNGPRRLRDHDEECRTAKRLTRRLERAAAAAAKRSDNTAAASAKHAWQTQRRSYRTLRNRKREAFWLNTVAANQSVVITGRLVTENAVATDISPLCPTIQSGSLRFRSFKYF